MSETRRRSTIATGCALGLAALASCTQDPFGSTPGQVKDDGPEEICSSSMDWLPQTPPLTMYLPQPHPDSECPFYRGAWQNFLIALQPTSATDPTGKPAILAYPTVDTLFQPKVPHLGERSFLGDIKQAGGRQILIDQNGNSLFYGIHVNPAYADFIQANQLQTAAQLQAYPSDPFKKSLQFPAGVAEYKTAWQVVEGDAAAVAQQTANYIWTDTTVPTLSRDPKTNALIEDRNTPRKVTARLLAIHVVFTMTGHPEFIWASFEHSMGAPDVRAADGKRDVAPTFGSANPDPVNDPENRMKADIVSMDPHVLYKAGLPARLADIAIPESQLNLVGQKFPDQSTSIYRMFPASKSNTTHPDDAVTSLNHNVETLFSMMAGSMGVNDKRGNYRLVGAQWMDKPRFFDVNIPIQNDASSPFLTDHIERVGDKFVKVPAISKAELTKEIEENGSDSNVSILAGEDRMSSTAMESFTQGVNSFPNCFSCHNTQAVVTTGVPADHADATAVKLLDPGLLNVSHVISQFLLEEHEAAMAAGVK